MKNGQVKLPNLPGMRFEDPEKTNFSKKQNFVMSGNTMLENYNPHTMNLQEEKLINTLKSTMGPKVEELMSSLNINRINCKENFEGEIPEEQAISPNVLLFKGFFEEKVDQSTIEKQMVRKVVIRYYLDDNTIEILEPVIRNSGIPQGKFLKRQKVPKDLDYREFVSFLDFRLGERITIFKKNIMINDCSQFTRQFYDSIDKPQGESFSPEKDEFEEFMERKNRKNDDPKLGEYKEYTEVRLGGGNFNKGLEKYLKNDGKTLLFDVVWDDRSFAGELNFYKLQFFLSDDKIEIKELHENNNGKTPFPLFLRRSYLPIKSNINHVPGMLTKACDYYQAKDLICGQTINIYNREFLLIGCSDFTREYFMNEFGIEQKPVEGYSRHKTNKKRTEMPPPPHNGFGSEEDSLVNCYQLVPKPPKLDMAKIFLFDKVVFRFACRFIKEKIEPSVKKLGVTFYCADDTLMANLITAKNSGIIGGKFAERRRYKSESTGTYFTPSEFYVGAIFHVNKVPLQIIKTDEFTLNYMESRPDMFKGHTRKEVAERLRNQIGSVGLSAIEDSLSKGKMSVEDLLERLSGIGAVRNYEDLYFLLNQAGLADYYMVDCKELVKKVKEVYA